MGSGNSEVHQRINPIPGADTERGQTTEPCPLTALVKVCMEVHGAEQGGPNPWSSSTGRQVAQ